MAEGSGEGQRKLKRRRSGGEQLKRRSSGGERLKRRRSGGEQLKLLPGEKIEVLAVDEGLAGSWHGGAVISREKGFRIIEYTDLLSEDTYSKLIESVPVSSAIDGRGRRPPKRKRGKIRPVPPFYRFKEFEIRYGLCVDALVDDAWWEGVVFDREEGSAKRLVFFPDQGDQQVITVDRLRLTQEWNETSSIWSPRGEWMLIKVLETFEKDDALPVSIREIWYDIRSTAAFLDDIGVWIFGSQSSWHRLVSELIQELLSVVRGLCEGDTQKQLIDLSTGFRDDDISLDKVPRLEGPKVSSSLRNYSYEATVNEVVQNPLIGSCRNSPGKEQGFSSNATSAFISEYHDRYNRGIKSSGERFDFLREKAKAHLLAVGWKFSSSEVGNKFYVSPSGKHYRSIIQACIACKEMESTDILSGNGCSNLISYDQGAVAADSIHKPKKKKVAAQANPAVKTAWQLFELEPEYCPQALELYLYSSQDRKREHENLKETHDGKKRMGLRVKKHLRTLGWKIESKKDPIVRIRLTSPEGKTFYSLHKACRYLLMNQQTKKRKFGATSSSDSDSFPRSCPVSKNEPQIDHSRCTHRPSVSGDVTMKQPFGSFRKCKNSGKQKLQRDAIKSRCTSIAPSQPRSSKRSREVLATVPIQQVARTVLSVLIDNDMVLPRQKVRYIRGRDGRVLMEGRITRDGIKCKCCTVVYTLTNFETHASGTYHRPAANIFLEDGRSLLDCQMDLVEKKAGNIKDMQIFSHPRLKSDCSAYENDSICSACHDDGELVLCDNCPSSFHIGCVGLEDVPEGKWFCPYCRCGECGLSEFNADTEQFTERTIIYCDQCEREYHVGCSRKKGSAPLLSCPVGKWFCSKRCSKIFSRLHKLIGKSRPTDREGLSWTILRSGKGNGVDREKFDDATTAEHHSKLVLALDVLHECFQTMTEPRTNSDTFTDIVFNRESELKRLNFWGFYTMLLEKGDELVSVATFRVFGKKIAEVPLVGTRISYRRQGMCRLLINELEKVLSKVGVEKLVLPAVGQLLTTWKNSFGFTEMPKSDQSKFLEYAYMQFPGTKLCEKRPRPRKHRKKRRGRRNQLAVIADKVDPQMDIVMSEACNQLAAIAEKVDPQVDSFMSEAVGTRNQLSVISEKVDPRMDSIMSEVVGTRNQLSVIADKVDPQMDSVMPEAVGMHNQLSVISDKVISDKVDSVMSEAVGMRNQLSVIADKVDPQMDSVMSEVVGMHNQLSVISDKVDSVMSEAVGMRNQLSVISDKVDPHMDSVMPEMVELDKTLPSLCKKKYPKPFKHYYRRRVTADGV